MRFNPRIVRSSLFTAVLVPTSLYVFFRPPPSSLLPASLHIPNLKQSIALQQIEMSCLQIGGSGLAPTIRLGLNLPLRPRTVALVVPVHSRLKQGNGDSNGEEPPESLFMKELKRRGVTPSSLLEDVEAASNRPGLEDVAAKEENGGGSGRSKRNGVASAEYERSASGQRELSMLLNSEGIEGLIPRAKILLTLGGTFFLGFWPLILTAISAFAALYFYFGPSFVHDASKIAISTPPYVDPYELLEDERISQLAPSLK